MSRAKIAGVNVPIEAKCVIVGVHPENCVFSPRQLKLIDFGLLQATSMNSFVLEKTDVSTNHMWVKEMASCTCIILE